MAYNLLLVEDDKSIREIITDFFQGKSEGEINIKTASDGNEGLDYIYEEEFDLIMLDVKMPGMNGLETLRHIRKSSATPVVLMTGDKELEASTEFAELGCDDYITKPFLPLLIKEVVHNMTERTTV